MLKKAPNVFGFPGDGKELPPGATQDSLELGALQEKLEPVESMLKSGYGKTPTSQTFHPIPTYI